jgi:glycosyltransferase involved in cell wall biosynthesis
MRSLRTQEDIMATWQSESDKPVVSICCITYNHEPYIEDALEGFLIQQTNFPFEILIHDDASTDATAEIIREYERAYPKLIKPIYQTENQYSKVRAMNPTFNYPRAKGDFIALCEGDDFWTEKNKLQKQVAYLQSHEAYSMCSHNVRFEFDGVVEKHNNYTARVIQDAGFEEILSSGIFIALNSIVFRKHLFEKPDWLGRLPGGHKALIYMLTGRGRNHHFLEEMAVKRRNPGGVTITQKKARSDSYFERNIFLLENLKVYFDHAYDRVINKKLRKLYARQVLSHLGRLRIKNAFQSLASALRLSN